MPQPERQQHQRPALGVVSDHDEGPQTFALAGLALPGRKEIEALVGGGELRLVFEAAPDRLGLAEIA